MKTKSPVYLILCSPAVLGVYRFIQTSNPLELKSLVALLFLHFFIIEQFVNTEDPQYESYKQQATTICYRMMLMFLLIIWSVSWLTRSINLMVICISIFTPTVMISYSLIIYNLQTKAKSQL